MKGAAIVCGALVCGSVFAQGVSPEQARLALEQKDRFVRQLLIDSPVSRRIDSSGSREAKMHFSSALDHYRIAQERMRADDPGAAETSLNEAIWAIGKARQIVPDNMQRLIGERVRYARLISGVEALRASYFRHLERSPRGDVSEDPELERVDALLDDARTLANAERIVEANKALENAELGLLSGLTRVLGSATLRYANRFATPHEEYAFELDRNASYRELIPVALRELRPSGSALDAMTRHVERGDGMRGQAQEYAARKDLRGALRMIRAATAQVQAALSAAGLVMPAETVAERAR